MKDQKIEILEIQVKETKEREIEQKQMYEKMFSALEQGNDTNTLRSANNSASRTKRPEELFNSTSISFGKEIENMQKQLQDEMQTRIKELENQVKQKDKQLIDNKLAFSLKSEMLNVQIDQINNSNQ